MNRYIHGGSEPGINYDFSVNVNPLGIQADLMLAMESALQNASCYPEYGARSLTEKLAQTHGLTADQLLITAGASEALVGVCRALKVKKGAVISPCFYGYKHALTSVGADIVELSWQDSVNSHLELAGDIDLLFLCNPNNPDGRALSVEIITEIINKAAAQGIYVVVDECFLPLSDEWQDSLIGRIDDYDNLIIVRAFTKTFAMAGIRLGYLACKNQTLIENIASTLPEWNVSSLAIAGGLEALNHLDYIAEARELIQKERDRLSLGLKELGFTVFDSAANFILFKGFEGLKERLLEQGILVRDCSNYSGLSSGYYRMAVLTPDKNDYLLKTLETIIHE